MTRTRKKKRQEDALIDCLRYQANVTYSDFFLHSMCVKRIVGPPNSWLLSYAQPRNKFCIIDDVELGTMV